MRWNNNDRDRIVELIVSNNERKINIYSEKRKLDKEKDILTKRVNDAEAKYRELKAKLDEKYPYVDTWDVKRKIRALAEIYVYNQSTENKPIDQDKDFFKEINKKVE